MAIWLDRRQAPPLMRAPLPAFELCREFRALTDQLLDMIARLRDVERAKQRVGCGSGDFAERAVEAEQLSRLVFRWARMQLQMAGQAVGAVQRGEQSPAPLVELEPRPLDRILAAWREAQLRFEIAAPGSPRRTLLPTRSNGCARSTESLMR